MVTAANTSTVYNKSAAEQPPEQQLLPITPTLHNHIITATTVGTSSVTTINTTPTATTMASSLR
jgi:hypothetical protein